MSEYVKIGFFDESNLGESVAGTAKVSHFFHGLFWVFLSIGIVEYTGMMDEMGLFWGSIMFILIASVGYFFFTALWRILFCLAAIIKKLDAIETRALSAPVNVGAVPQPKNSSGGNSLKDWECRACGYKNGKFNTYCLNCGHKNAEARQVNPPVNEKTLEEWQCSACGFVNGRLNNYCLNCSTKKR